MCMNSNTDIIHCMHISKSCDEYFNIVICNLYYFFKVNPRILDRKYAEISHESNI